MTEDAPRTMLPKDQVLVVNAMWGRRDEPVETITRHWMSAIERLRRAHPFLE